MPETFVLNDQTVTGNMVAHQLYSTLKRGCRYLPDHPWQEGQGRLVDDETGHVFACFRKQEGKKVIVLSDGRKDFLPSILTISTAAS